MKVEQAWRSGCGVGVVKTSEDWSRQDARGRLADGCAVDRRVSQGLVPAALVVVADELGEDRAEVLFAEDDQMVEALRGAVCHHIRESSDEFSHVLQGEGLLHKS